MLLFGSSLLPIVLALVLGARAADARERQRVLLVSLDGFRYDYLTRDAILLPGFNQFRVEGASVDHVVPAFTTKTFPCHTTIVTGRYQEHHGIINNNMFDPVTNKTFNMLNKDPFWWEYNNSLPIWISAVKSGLRSGVYFWPGSEVPRQNLTATSWLPYEHSTPLSAKFAKVVEWLKAGYELVLLYHHEPDSVAHKWGPNSANTSVMLSWLDDQFTRFFSTLMDNKLFDSVNIIITADHGMAEIVGSIVLQNYGITNADISVVATGPNLEAYFNPSANEQIVWNKLQSVKKWKLYRRQDIPDRLHYRDNSRIPPILAIADEGLEITENSPFEIKGDHGYDNAVAQMWPLFMARGPAFKKGYRRAQEMQQVDIYPLVCELLQIKCEPHDGDLSRVQDLLATGGATRGSAAAASISLLALATFALAFRMV